MHQARHATMAAVPASSPPPPMAASQMQSVISALLEMELPDPNALAERLDPTALANIVVGLIAEVKAARAEVSRLKAAVGTIVASQVMAQQQQMQQQQQKPQTQQQPQQQQPQQQQQLLQQQQQQMQQQQLLQLQQQQLAAQTGFPKPTQPSMASNTTTPPTPSGKESWAWGTGTDREREKDKEKDKEREKERSGSAEKKDRDRERRSRSRDRKRRDDGEKKKRESTPEREAKERDRAFVQGRKNRANEEAPQRRLGADVEESRGKFRASCTFMGDRGPVTSVGPWRRTHEKATDDADEFMAAYKRGGDAAVQSAKVALLKRATAEGGEEAASEHELNVPVDAEYPWPIEIEGPSKSSSTLGGYRACVTFPNTSKPTYEGAKPRKPIPVKCPWRLGPRAKTSAENDARLLCEAYKHDGEAGMQEKKRDFFRNADADAKAARMGRGKDDTLQNIFQSSSTSTSTAKDEDGDFPSRRSNAREAIEADTVEEDIRKGPENRGHRAKCCFPSERGSAPVQISGPWRKSRTQAEQDISELRTAFEEAGVSGANAKRMAMLRRGDEIASESVPKGELSEGDLANRYGKGFKLLAGMGFSTGTGLGRGGQGRKIPVEAVDAEIAAATASRHLGLGFAEIAGLGGPADD
eukprot:TRINITY_DN32488_c0_g4_i1.p1 TRINITY_DN32488_c0_g4~~TRINITY_DN32488_c0_g4_i1.p1  ORF type:complete len:641 (-),score=171.92 TRINITY_DN32488_c0_g4_i1:505-2427(-)